MSFNRYEGVVVGVDGSQESLAALDWAARAAHLHDTRLTVVVTYAVPMTGDPGIGDLIGDLRDQARAAADAARARLGELRPGDQDVKVVIVQGNAAHELSQRSESCDLVVVGRRGLGAFERVVLGSTSSALAATAPGAVVVVPAGATTGDPLRIRVGVGRDDEPDVLGAAFAEADGRGCALEVLYVADNNPFSSALPELDSAAASWHEAAKADLADRVARWSEKYPRVTCSIVLRHGDRASMLVQGLTPDDLVVVGGRRHQPVMGRLLHSVPDAVLRSAPCPIMVVHVRRHAIA